VTAQSWILPAGLETPGLARQLARSYAAENGADPETVSAVALCVSEAVTNVVVHAYRDRDEPGDVEIEVRKPDGFICLFVRDRGEGLTPRVDGRGLGLGLPIIASAAASTEFRRRDEGGTELVMRFDLPGTRTDAARTAEMRRG
jgi:serine/threonine-protein kinase RsbW